jgi:hypothetical protein
MKYWGPKLITEILNHFADIPDAEKILREYKKITIPIWKNGDENKLENYRKINLCTTQKLDGLRIFNQ